MGGLRGDLIGSRDEPPTWGRALPHGVVAAGVLALLSWLVLKASFEQTAAYALVGLIGYTPISYYVNKLIYQRRDGTVKPRGGVKLRPKGSRSTLGSIVELVVIILIALGLALGIQAWIVTPYRIPSGSMEPTLTVGQRVLVDRMGMHFSEPHVGEIAVFHPPEGAKQEECGDGQRVSPGGAPCSRPVEKEASENFIKRVVAGPGDTIKVIEGHVVRNGKREKDSYIRPCPGVSECNFPVAIKIPPGHWFMMGDNRGDSDDSRFWGPVPTSWIIGDAFATYWPPGRIGIL